MIDELNIASTIICFKARAAKMKELPQRVQFVAHDEFLSAQAWRSCAIEYLERREKARMEKETIYL